MFCTILTDGRPHRYYATKESALEAARRHFIRTQEGVEVAWCREVGNPKVWVAYVTRLGIERTRHWYDPVAKSIRYVVRDRATKGVDFLLWGDDDRDGAQASLLACLTDGLDVELVTMPSDRMDAHTKRLIDGRD